MLWGCGGLIVRRELAHPFGVHGRLRNGSVWCAGARGAEPPEAGEIRRLVQDCVAGLSPPPVVRLLRLPDLQDKDDICEFVERCASAGESSEGIRAEIDITRLKGASGSCDRTPDKGRQYRALGDCSCTPGNARRVIGIGGEEVRCHEAPPKAVHRSWRC